MSQFSVGVQAGPEVNRLARAIDTHMEQLRANGVAKVAALDFTVLPTDGSVNFAVVTNTSNGTVPGFFDGAEWKFLDGTTMT